MYKEAEFRQRCSQRGLDEAATESAVAVIRGLEASLARDGTPSNASSASLAEASLLAVDAYAAGLAERGAADSASTMALARYFAVIGRDEVSVRLLAYLLAIGVLPSMADRLKALEGEELASRVLEDLSFPPEGSPPEDYPRATAAFVESLERELGQERAGRILCCNVHGIPASAYESERAVLERLGSIDLWLADYHRRLVETLELHAADGTLWYEQRITPEVVDFVRSDQEIQSGVRQGDTIFVKKIPYDPDHFIRSDDPLERRRLACHCPLAASSITESNAGVSSSWCACSAGYEKFKFDVAFGEETEVRVVSSVLAGDPRCRFAVKIPQGALHYA